MDVGNTMTETVLFAIDLQYNVLTKVNLGHPFLFDKRPVMNRSWGHTAKGCHR